jgi:hypothetical protein
MISGTVSIGVPEMQGGPSDDSVLEICAVTKEMGKVPVPNSVNVYEAMFSAFRQYLVERTTI